MELGSHWVVAGWVSLHIVAFSLACITRMATGSRLESLVQLGFFAAMAVMGAATWVGQKVDIGWTWSAMTLMAMVIIAIIDFRRISEPAPASLPR